MNKLRYALGVVGGLALAIPAGAVMTAPDAAAGNHFISGVTNSRTRIIPPRLRLRVINPDRVLPEDSAATEPVPPKAGGKPAPKKKVAKSNRPAKKRRVALRRPPRLPNSRPLFFADELDLLPDGLLLAGGFKPDEVLVSLPIGGARALAESIAAANDLEILEILPLPLLSVQIVKFRLSAGQSVRDVINGFSGNPDILDIQPNFLSYLAGSATATSIQYAPAKIHVDKAHRIAKGRDVLVAVIDSGIDAEHPELSTSVAEKFEAIDFDPAGEKRHGTAMAAVIAANSQLLGIAPSVRLLSARAFGVPKGGSKASATTFAILKAMQWSYERGARVFNLSFAGPRDPALIKGLDALAANDVIMVAAAGNAGPDTPPVYPGAHTDVIAVTAIDTADVLFDMANNGKYVALAAPGVNVMTATPGNRYELMSGTSVAAAHVTGVVALMMERDPELKPGTVRQTLSDSAVDLGPEGRDSGYGAGLVNAHAALEQIERTHLVAAE